MGECTNFYMNFNLTAGLGTLRQLTQFARMDIIG